MRRLSLLLALFACHREFAGEGELGGRCYANGTCNDGLSCIARTCKAFAIVDVLPVGDAATDALFDAYVPDAACNMANEPNESTGTATSSGADAAKTVTLGGLAICPVSDVDVFAVAIATPGENIEAFADYATAGSGIALSILNAGGVSIANGTPPTGQPTRVRAYIPNVPTGAYYVQVRTTSVVDTYSLAVNITGP